jgi:hypothetical protein
VVAGLTAIFDDEFFVIGRDYTMVARPGTLLVAPASGNDLDRRLAPHRDAHGQARLALRAKH